LRLDELRVAGLLDLMDLGDCCQLPTGHRPVGDGLKPLSLSRVSRDRTLHVVLWHIFKPDPRRSPDGAAHKPLMQRRSCCMNAH